MDPNALPTSPRPVYLELPEPSAKPLELLAEELTEKLDSVETGGPEGLTAVFEVNLSAVISLGFDPKRKLTREDIYRGLTEHLAERDLVGSLGEAKLIELRRE